MFAALLVLSGCGGRESAQSRVSSFRADVSAAAATTEPTLAQIDDPAGETSPTSDGEPPHAAQATTTIDAGQVPAANVLNVHELPAEKLLLLSPSGPIRLDIVVLIDGRPWRSLRQDAATNILNTASAESEPPRWVEALSDPRFDFGRTSYGELRNPWDRRRAAGLLDTRKNGFVDAAELLHLWETIDSIGHALTFDRSRAVKSASHTSRIWSTLDANADGRLDDEELVRATAALRTLDINLDDGLTGDELDAQASDRTMAMPNAARREEGTPIAFLLDDALRWESLRLAWAETYANDADHASLLAAKRAILDQNGDDRLTTSELKRVAEIEADVIWPVALGTCAATEGCSLPHRTVRLPGQGVETQDGVAGSHSWNIEIDGSLLRLHVQDALAVAPSPEWAKLDGDHDGVVTEAELGDGPTPARGHFARADVNRDSRVDTEEQAQYAQVAGDIARGRLAISVDEPRDAWLAAFDCDSDDRLSTREIESADQVCRQVAREHQRERPQAGDAAMVLRVRVAPGAAAAMIPRASPAAADHATPRWFRAMDVNEDGDLSRTEFLGDQAQFDRFDRDQDGLVSGAETVAP